MHTATWVPRLLCRGSVCFAISDRVSKVLSVQLLDSVLGQIYYKSKSSFAWWKHVKMKTMIFCAEMDPKGRPWLTMVSGDLVLIQTWGFGQDYAQNKLKDLRDLAQNGSFDSKNFPGSVNPGDVVCTHFVTTFSTRACTLMMVMESRFYQSVRIHLFIWVSVWVKIRYPLKLWMVNTKLD